MPSRHPEHRREPQRPRGVRWPWPWPLPALLAWLLAWLLYLRLEPPLSPVLALCLACVSGVGLSALSDRWWRRAMIALGFPLSLALSGLAAVPTWAWLLAALVLLLVYPLNAWRDAPLFPTPAKALQELSCLAPLPAGANVLDAGCGLGHGLKALRAAYPQAQLLGVEWSWLLRGVCALRCPWARVQQGDLWQCDWRECDLVYLFQRPESMARAADKAMAELPPGAWLVSLEFEAEALLPTAVIGSDPQRPVWLYRAPLRWRQSEQPMQQAPTQ